MGEMTMQDIMNPGSWVPDPSFPNAPRGWSRVEAETLAREQGLTLNDDHWDAIRALQNYYAKRNAPGGHQLNIRGVHDALDERFHAKGGLKYVYELFPGGPLAQGGPIAGLEPPAGAADKGFGSVI